MKISRLLLTAAFGSAILVACGGSQTEEKAVEENGEQAMEKTKEMKSVDVDTKASTVGWNGEMLGVYSHSGVIKLKDGHLEMKGDNITGGSFTVDMTSIKPTDENYDPSKDKTKEKLIGHLSSPDFFDVSNHPTAKFEVTGSGENTVTGNMTIRGITNEETITNVQYNEATGSYTGDLTIDRKKYDVNFTMSVQDMVLSDDIELTFNIAT